MFFGYDSEAQMRENNPGLADHLISIAEKYERTVCTREKECTGSINGKDFMYADGSKDFGVTVIYYKAKHEGDEFRWSMQGS